MRESPDFYERKTIRGSSPRNSRSGNSGDSLLIPVSNCPVRLGSKPIRDSRVSAAPGNVMVSALYRSGVERGDADETGEAGAQPWTLRVYEGAGKAERAEVRLPWPVGEAYEMDLLEERGHGEHGGSL